jgi:hypothetical protein
MVGTELCGDLHRIDAVVRGHHLGISIGAPRAQLTAAISGLGLGSGEPQRPSLTRYWAAAGLVYTIGLFPSKHESRR